MGNKHSLTETQGGQGESVTGERTADGEGQQMTMGDIEEGDESWKEGKTEKEIEQVEDMVVRNVSDDLDEEQEEIVTNNLSKMKQAIGEEGFRDEDARTTELQKEKVEFQVGEPEEREGEDTSTVVVEVNSNNTINEGTTHEIKVSPNEAMSDEQAKRVTEREIAYGNGVAEKNNTATETARQEITDMDPKEGREYLRENYDKEDLQLENSNDNLGRPEMKDAILQQNEMIDDLFENDDLNGGFFGGRENADSLMVGTDSFANTVEELENDEEGFNAGTNVWQYQNETLSTHVEEGGVEPKKEYREYIDVMNIMSEESDMVAENDTWESGETVFGEISPDDDDASERIKEVAGKINANGFDGAGASRNILNDIREKADQVGSEQ